MNPEDPKWVDAILDWRWTWLLARLGLCGAYLIGGVEKLLNFPAAVMEQEHFGLYPGPLWAVIAITIELVGPALIILGRLSWLGAGALGALTLVASVAANDFWNKQGADRFAATNAFFEHMGLIAGLVMAAVIAAHENRRVRRSRAPST